MADPACLKANSWLYYVDRQTQITTCRSLYPDFSNPHYLDWNLDWSNTMDIINTLSDSFSGLFDNLTPEEQEELERSPVWIVLASIFGGIMGLGILFVLGLCLRNVFKKMITRLRGCIKSGKTNMHKGWQKMQARWPTSRRNEDHELDSAVDWPTTAAEVHRRVYWRERVFKKLSRKKKDADQQPPAYDKRDQGLEPPRPAATVDLMRYNGYNV